MSRRKSPQPSANGKGGEKEVAIDCDSLSKIQNDKAEFWLHVGFDGTEICYPSEPRNVKTLHVLSENGIETTTTRNIRSFEGLRCDIVTVRPRGRGWVLLDGSSDNFTKWRREVLR